MLITPKNAIEIVLVRKSKNSSFRLFETSTQRNFFWLAFVALGLGAVAALLTYFWQNQYLIIFALFALLVASISVLIYQISTLLPELLKFRNAERAVKPIVD